MYKTKSSLISNIFIFFLNQTNFEFLVFNVFFRTLISALHVWLDSYPEDFKDPPSYSALKELLHFCEEYLPATELDAKVRHRLER